MSYWLHVNVGDMVGEQARHTKCKHKSRGRHQPIRDKHTSEVQVKLELVNTGIENVAKTQKS